MIEGSPILSFSREKLKRMDNQVRKSTVTGRTFDGYCKMLNISADSLKDKKILDIGAGNSKFADTAVNYGADVTNLDARYSSDSVDSSGKLNKVKAYMQHLPFKNDSFNCSLALYSLNWLGTSGDVRKSLAEMIRVTEGQIKISPVYLRFGLENKEAFDERFKKEPVNLKTCNIPPYETFYQLDIYVDKSIRRNWQNIVAKLVSHLDFNLEARAQKAWMALKRIQKPSY